MSITQNEANPAVDSPPHYVAPGGLEVIDVIDAFDLTHYEAMIVSYVIRARHKGGLTDLLRTKYYIDRLIRNVTAEKERGTRRIEARQRLTDEARHEAEARHGAE